MGRFSDWGRAASLASYCRRKQAILFACRLMNSGGNAFPIICATANFPRSRANRYDIGNDCNKAASRKLIVRFATGCRKRPFEGLQQPPVIVGETSSRRGPRP